MSKYLYCPTCNQGYIEKLQHKIDNPRCIFCWTTREVYDNKDHFLRCQREDKLKRILKDDHTR